MTKLVHVAVGVIEDSHGNIFIAQRAADAHQGGLWEFPGGKLEADETTPQALQRELREELAIEVECCEPLIQIRHHYPDKSVLLDVYRVTQFRGQPTGNEGQPVLWVNKAELVNYSFPAANKPIVKAIVLPDRLAITGAFANHRDFSEKLDSVFRVGVAGAILRIENISPQLHLDLVSSAAQLANKQKALLQLNASFKNYLLFVEHLKTTPVGLHMNRHELMVHSQRPVAPDILLGASCHNLLELAKAVELGVDYILLSPVLPTSSHPDADPLGWQIFTDWVSSVNIPVYALGGMNGDHLVQAKHCGAQGIASISTWWPD
jgi:8-oxo-dGTP diphosphatase